MFFCSLISNHLHNCTGRIRLKQLLVIDADAIGGEGLVLEHGVEGELLCYGGDDIVVDIVVKASDDVVVVDRVVGLAIYRVLLNLCREFNAEVEHNLEQKVERGSIHFDIIHRSRKHILRHGKWVIVNFLHIRGIKFEDTEADVKIF